MSLDQSGITRKLLDYSLEITGIPHAPQSDCPPGGS
jgi:hypothetical protein